MRDIEFRGKSKYDGRWHYGYLVYEIKDKTYKITDGKGLYYFVETETVGQFTGLCDKNGTKIFEGDIVINDLGDKFLAELGFNEEHYYPVSKLKLPHKDCRVVIGNIHDNPELLQKEV